MAEQQGGLLSFLGSPVGQGLLGTLAGGLAGGGRTVAGNAGRGLLAGLGAFNSAQENQIQQQRYRTQDDWLKTQRSWMEQERARADADRTTRENFLANALAPQPQLQQSQATADLKATNPYTDPNFIFGTAKANGLPGVDQVPMVVKPINPIDAIRARYSPEEAAQLQSLTSPPKPRTMSVKPGERILNADTFQEVYSAPESAADQPSSVREYEFAKGQGFEGSYQDWVMSQKRASAPSVAVNMSDPTAVARAALSFQKDYRDATKPSFTRASAYNAMVEASRNPTAKGDLTMVYSFIKALDPESVVREGEIDLVNANRSIPDRVKGYAQRLATGKSLLPSERQDLLEQARSLSFTDYSRSRNDIKAFRENAKRLSLDPDLYAPDPYSGVDFGPRSFGSNGQAPGKSQIRRFNPATGKIE